MSVLKFMKNYIQDSSATFSIFSLVRILTSVIYLGNCVVSASHINWCCLFASSVFLLICLNVFSRFFMVLGANTLSVYTCIIERGLHNGLKISILFSRVKSNISPLEN